MFETVGVGTVRGMTTSPPPDALRAPARRQLTPDRARALIARLEAATPHMRASGDRALLGVIASNDRRIAELHEDIAAGERPGAGDPLPCPRPRGRPAPACGPSRSPRPCGTASSCASS